MISPRRIWTDLFARNPMLIEITRFRRRYFSFRGNASSAGVLALAIVAYVGLVLSVLSGRGEIAPNWIVIFQSGLVTLLAPAMMYGTIAGERERRSWDLLLVAPISKAQIVAGKFLGAVAGIGGVLGLFLLPILLAAVTYRKTNWHDLLLSELVAASFALFVCGLTLLISARVRRPLMALGGTLGTLALGLVVFPLLAATLLNNNWNSLELLYLFHPLVVLTQIDRFSAGNWDQIYPGLLPPSMWGYMQVAVYTVFAVIFVVWAGYTLIFAENDVRFIPRKTDA